VYIRQLYKKFFVLDENLEHRKNYCDNQHIIFAHHHHSKEQLEFQGRMYLYSLCNVKMYTSPAYGVNQGQSVDGGGSGDGGDDGGSDGPGASVQDGSSDDDNAEMGRKGFYTASSWNPPAPYQNISFFQEIANVRRALYLCDIPDAFHTTLITVGGIKTVHNFSVMSMAKWEAMANLMANQKAPDGVQLIVKINNQRLLVALSLWVRVKVTLGKTHHNFDEMTKEQLEVIAKSKLCDTQTGNSAELEYLMVTKQYVPWQIRFHCYCWHQYNSEGVPYVYVIRDKVPPPKFNTLMEELIYLLPVDMKDAQFWSDSNLVFSYLEQVIQAKTAKPHVQNKAKQLEQNRQSVFLQMNAQFKGEDVKPHNLLDAESKIGKLSWNNSPSFTPEKFTSTLTKYFNILEEIGEVWTDLKKIWAIMQSICRNNYDMVQKNLWIHNVRDELQENWGKWEFSHALEIFNAKARHNQNPKRSISGINGKKGCGNKSKKSQLESASNDSSNSNVSLKAQQLRRYKLNGEPTKNVIEGIDISPILMMKSHLADFI